MTLTLTLTTMSLEQTRMIKIFASKACSCRSIPAKIPGMNKSGNEEFHRLSNLTFGSSIFCSWAFNGLPNPGSRQQEGVWRKLMKTPKPHPQCKARLSLMIVTVWFDDWVWSGQVFIIKTNNFDMIWQPDMTRYHSVECGWATMIQFLYRVVDIDMLVIVILGEASAV